jgi:hypothetical protein
MTLDNLISDEEIQKVFLSLKDNKVLSPNGFSMGFFNKTWSIISLDNLNVVHSFLISSRLLKQDNATSIALIPKVPNLTQVKNFRTISCCNTVFKCIAKIIANRVQSVLLDLLSLFQYSFIEGRNINDNILLS